MPVTPRRLIETESRSWPAVSFPHKNVDEEIPFQIYRNKRFQAVEKFDYVIFCQSPSYMPKNAEHMLDVTKEYILKI